MVVGYPDAVMLHGLHSEYAPPGENVPLSHVTQALVTQTMPVPGAHWPEVATHVMPD